MQNFKDIIKWSSTNYNKKREERKKEKDPKGTSKLHLRYHQYHKKNLDKTNIIIPKKVINIDWSGPYMRIS